MSVCEFMAQKTPKLHKSKITNQAHIYTYLVQVVDNSSRFVARQGKNSVT